MHRKTILAGVSAFALLMGGATAASAQDSATATVDQHVWGNTSEDFGSTRVNNLSNSEIGSSGIAQWQQNNGSNNALGITNAVQANIDSDFDLTANASVTQFTKYTDTTALGGDEQQRTNRITNSYTNFSGVSNTQQNNGDHNVLGIANAVHTRIDTVAFTSEQGDVTQDVLVDQETGGHNSGWFTPLTDHDQDRTNSIAGSYNGASGVNNAQQNNGTGNALGIANSVAVDVGGSGNQGNKDNVVQTVEVTGTILKHQFTRDDRSDRTNTVNNSFNGSAGISNVQQNNGDVNVLGIGNAVMANVGLGFELNDLNNDVTQNVNVTGDLHHVFAKDTDTPGINGDRRNGITNSFNNNASGIANVQQNNGSNNIMGIGNAVQANIDSGPVGSLNGDDVASQVANASGGNIGNVTMSRGFGLAPPAAHRRNTVSNSFNAFTGIANVQQNNGDNNIIVASTAVAASVRSDDKFDFVSGATATTSGEVKKSSAHDRNFHGTGGTNRANGIAGSFDGAHGILGVQQNNGSNNVMAIANTVVANVATTQDPSAEGTSNTAQAEATVRFNSAKADGFVDRNNSVTNSFNNASGIANVQQNNGANNVMGIANSVSAELGNDLDAGWGPGVTSLATVHANVSGNFSLVGGTQGGGGYINTNNNAFNNFSGISTVQQNNGSNNSIQASTAVTANLP